MQHFYVKNDKIEGHRLSLEGEDYNHCINVLRMKKGEAFIACDEGGMEYYCIIDSFENGVVNADISYRRASEQELSCPVTIYQGIPKSDKLELIIQKCVELGAVRIVPVEMKRCIAKVDASKAASKQKRWQAIAEAAAKQCGRGILPEVGMPMTYTNAVKDAENADVKLLPYELADEKSSMDETRKVFESILPGQSVAVFIGPEGGFDESEVEKACECGFKAVTLGKRILRTETAGLYIMSVLGYLLEGK